MKTFRFSKQLKKLKAAKTVSDINHFFIFLKAASISPSFQISRRRGRASQRFHRCLKVPSHLSNLFNINNQQLYLTKINNKPFHWVVLFKQVTDAEKMTQATGQERILRLHRHLSDPNGFPVTTLDSFPR